MTRVLVTGASGFVGRELCATLRRSGYLVRAALRSTNVGADTVDEPVVVGEINSTTDWQPALKNVQAIIHVAARAHAVNHPGDNSDLYVETNARGTQRLVAAAANAGVRELIYLSSVKVNGEETRGRAYSASDNPAPQDVYGTTKWLGERFTMELATNSEMTFSIVRSPLVYGPGVKANFLRLLRWVDKEWPLPFAAIENARSLVSIWNLCDLLVRLLNESKEQNRIWMVSDGEDLSTPDLIHRIERSMHRRVRMLPIPPSLLLLMGRMTGRSAEINRLCGSLTIDIKETCDKLAWKPPITVDEGIARTVAWYLREGKQLGS